MKACVIAAALLLVSSAAAYADDSAPLTVPFDYSKSEIGLDVTIKGQTLHMILDTGVDPSAIDIARAAALGLAVDHGISGEASGAGDGKGMTVFPATIEGLAFKGRSFAPFDALATDMSGLSKHYGRQLDGILGYSFLKDKIVLIDYPHRTLSVLARPADAVPAVRRCTKHWSIALIHYGEDMTPIISDFRLGKASGPISLDTGSSGGIALYKDALALPGVKAALTEKGKRTSMGARGTSAVKTYVLNEPVGFGPFTLPKGQVVSLFTRKGADDARVANVGNKLFAALTPRMLLDYPAKRITFYAGCAK